MAGAVVETVVGIAGAACPSSCLSLKHEFDGKSKFLDLFVGVLEASLKVSDLVVGGVGRFLCPEGSRFGYMQSPFNIRNLSFELIG